MNWSVYIILCSDDSLYTGISTDVLRRFDQHGQHKGARYFWSRQPVRLVYLESGHNRVSASQREYAIKRLSRTSKWDLIESAGNQIDSLFSA